MVKTRTLTTGIFAAAAYIAMGSTACQALELTSPDVTNGAALGMAQVHGRCGGGNQSPALAWSGAPKSTESYAVTMFDSDANGGRGFWHWIMYDVPENVQGLPAGAGALPDRAVQTDNDFGTRGYGGACPPPGSGTHHYALTVYALAAAHLPLDGNAGAAEVAAYLKAHALATATITGTYRR